MDTEMQGSCMIAPPPMQTYHGICNAFVFYYLIHIHLYIYIYICTHTYINNCLISL